VTAPRGGRERRKHRFSRGVFYTHLWVGVFVTVALTVISVTGILLNHKRGLGLMPDVEHAPSGPLQSSLTVGQLADSAIAAVPGGATDPVVRVDRMDVRPRDGLIKVRLRDSASTEVTLDLATGRVLHVGRRGDVFLEKLHSGEIFGGRGILLSDIAAVGLLFTLVSGYWIWLFPKWMHRDAGRGGEENQ
jgi:uncharacterized iron-regulated membrane protein